MPNASQSDLCLEPNWKLEASIVLWTATYFISGSPPYTPSRISDKVTKAQGSAHSAFTSTVPRIISHRALNKKTKHHLAPNVRHVES